MNWFDNCAFRMYTTIFFFLQTYIFNRINEGSSATTSPT